MITLYTKPFCPYCQKVKVRIDELAIPYTEKSVEDENNLKELIEKGGKRMVPYMVDEDNGIAMYESGDIITYLESLKR